MGFVPSRTLYKLDFSQTEYAGLEVTTRSASMATLLAILTLHEAAEEADAKDALAKLDELFGLFEGVLVSWNVETEDGEAVPATKAGLLSQDSPFCLAVIQMWASAMSQAPPPLPKPSGDTSLEESIPMTPGQGS